MNLNQKLESILSCEVFNARLTGDSSLCQRHNKQSYSSSMNNTKLLFETKDLLYSPFNVEEIMEIMNLKYGISIQCEFELNLRFNYVVSQSMAYHTERALITDKPIISHNDGETTILYVQELPSDLSTTALSIGENGIEYMPLSKIQDVMSFLRGYENPPCMKGSIDECDDIKFIAFIQGIPNEVTILRS